MPSTKQPNAEARLEDLDVREVSVVDRPANKRKFLIVKSVDGLEVIRMEEGMPRNAIPANRAEEMGFVPVPVQDEPAPVAKEEDTDDSLLDLFGFGDDLDPENPDVVDDGDDDGEVVIVTKGVKAMALKETNAALQNMMKVTNTLRGLAEKSGEVSKEVAAQFGQISEAITATLAKMGEKGGDGDDKDAAHKAADAAAVFAACKATVERLMACVNKIKALDDNAEEIPADVKADLAKIAKALGIMAQKFGGAGDTQDDKGDDQADKGKAQKREGLEIFLKHGSDGDDPEVILKAGAKMRRARLSKLKAAIKALNEVLIELDPSEKLDDDDGKDDKKGKKKPAKKSEGPSLGEKLVGAITTLTEKVDGLGTQVQDITKRVGEMEDTRPAGATNDDPPAEVQKKQSMWSGII